ncbi:MAG: FGGY-family carbohydrate kinase [Acidimicrobiia bacterium]
MSSSEVTVGVDIGTSSVKAIAADGDGNVVASARVPHDVHVPSPGRFEHDANVAWRRGPSQALAEVSSGLDVKGVSVAAMVPSLTAVDAEGAPLVPGLLYGDERGREATAGKDAAKAPTERGELLGFMTWAKREAPNAAGFWPAQGVANKALSGEAVIDATTAATAHPFYDYATGWSPDIGEQLGVGTEQMPRVLPPGWKGGQIYGDGPPLASGAIDALAEQIVAGADNDGDVLVIFGTTLIIWAVTTSQDPVPGYWTIPHTAPGKLLVGGPSNAGGMFCNWVSGWIGDGGTAEPNRVPVWAPYARGERAPLHDPSRRAVLADLDLTHDAAAIRRAAFEASAFVVRRVLDTAREHIGLEPRRIVATGGGVRVDEWVQAVADATQLPIDCVAVPEGGALGSAWLARIAAGLEDVTAVTEGRRWARIGRRFEADNRWVAPMEARYRRFLDLS